MSKALVAMRKDMTNVGLVSLLSNNKVVMVVYYSENLSKMLKCIGNYLATKLHFSV